MSKEKNTTKIMKELLQQNAISFAVFVSNDPVFDDFWSMSKEHQERIYQEFVNQNKDE